MLGFAPLIVGVLLWLALRHPGRYCELRTLLLVSVGLALVIHLAYPVAPPRLMPELGIADTVGLSARDGSFAGVRFNPYAAMPSMHVGWSVLVGAGPNTRAPRRSAVALRVSHTLEEWRWPPPRLRAGRLVPAGQGRNGVRAQDLPPDRGVQQMIQSGDTLENPVTGERLVFHRTSRDTNGEAVLVETIVRPGGSVAAAHLHPYQSERFQVLGGTLALRVGSEERLLVPGDVAMVPPGTPHRFWNAGETDARFTVKVRPALRFESLIETMFTLAAEGKTNGRGIPNPLRLAVIARAHFDTVRLPFLPAPVQRAALALGASIGEALGYRATTTRRAADRSRASGRDRNGATPARGGASRLTLDDHDGGDA